MKPAVFLDRDGVINYVVMRDGLPHPPASADSLEFLPGVAEAIGILRTAGFHVIVVTNQPDVATGVQQRQNVEAIHEKMLQALPIDGLKVCYHVDEDGCSCRKPKPGMLLEAATESSLDLHQSYMIGDRWRDIEAGRAAGCKTVLIDYNYPEKQAESPDMVASSLLAASQLILASRV